ncbi:MAG: CbtA family protein [Methyloceanibacter sp.]
MDYFRNIVVVAILAGVIAGTGMTIAQHFATVPLILKAESYEGEGTSEPAHDHGAAAAAHEHDHGGWQPSDGFERAFFSFLANIVTGIGFALLLVATSELFGGIKDWRQGVFWGLAGFAAFTLAPGLGLPPELPAMPAAELGPRQLWWVATVLATAVALGLLFYQRSFPAVIAAIALLVAPHLIGAPQPASYGTPIPEGLHHSFVVAVVLSTLLFWLLLGGLAGLFRERFIPAR